MKSFRVYRVFSTNDDKKVLGRELGRQEYRFSIIVSDESADYVVNPASAPEENLKFLRERLVRMVETLEQEDTPPKDIDSWSRAAAENLGMYNKFSLVLEINEEAGPLADFEEIRAREQRQIDRWITYSVTPLDSAAEDANE
jgi:hypothetical protein